MNTREILLVGVGGVMTLILFGGGYFMGLSEHSVPLHADRPSPTGTAPTSQQPSFEIVPPVKSAEPAAAAKTDGGPVPHFKYTMAGQLMEIIYPDGSHYTYCYNGSGDKISETDTKGGVWTYVYDKNHHALSIVSPEGHVVTP